MEDFLETPNSAVLKRKSIQGVIWTTGGYAFSQVLRLASNLIMTRLLAPEYFGLMALVNVFMIGLGMFSDIGLGPNIIQSPRSNERDFLNAAWTVQIMRGGLLWVICLVGGFPLAAFYNEPALILLVPAAGLSSLIGGFTSTNYYTNNRDLNMARLTTIEILSQLIALISMFLLGLIYPSVWVLVAGSLVSIAARLVGSHYFLPGISNQWHWEPQTIKGLINFGQWIFFSTALSFASNSMGSLILGKLVSMKEVGLFSLAVTLAKAVEQVYEQISQRILFPVYSQIKSIPNHDLRRKVKKIRLGVMGLFLPMLWTLVLFGEFLVQFLFDNRYHGASWILRIFAVGLIPTIVSGIGPFYLAMGNAKLMMKMSAVKLVAYLSCMLLGWFIGQSDGVIVGMACFTFLVYIADAVVQHHYKIWIPELDLLGFVTSAAVIGGAFLLWGFH